MGIVIDKLELARCRARKRYKQELADVRAGKKLSPDCACFTAEVTKLMRLERKLKRRKNNTLSIKKNK